MTNPPDAQDTMAVTDQSIADVTELCDRCGRETLHDVAVTILTEGGEGETAAFSREPYRVSECRECGATSRLRMNNA